MKGWPHIFGQQQGYLSLFSGTRPPSGEYPNRNSIDEKTIDQRYFRWPEEAKQAARWVDEESRSGREVYHCGHLVTRQRRKKQYAAPMMALYVDGDGAEVPDGLPQPTLTIQSSPDREQFYWKLKFPIPPERGEELNKRLAYALGADKSGWDLTQLLRPSGTQNHKYEGTPTVEIKEIVDEGYDPDYLDRVLPPLEKEQGSKGGETSQSETKTPVDNTQEPPVRLDKYGIKVWNGENPKLKEDGSVDRSASLLNIGRVLEDGGASRDTIAKALRERDESLGWNKYTYRKDSESQYERIIDVLERGDEGTSGTSGYDEKLTFSSIGERVLLGKVIRQGIKPPEELIEGILLKGKIHHVFAAPGCGKSWLALWLAMKLINEGKTVLYLDAENGISIIAERLQALGADPERLEECLQYYPSPNLSMAKEETEAYVRLLEEVNPDLVVFDSWVNFLSGASLDENVSSDIARWAVAFLRPARNRGMTVLLLDHVPKDGSTARGSGRKKEEADVQWQLNNPKSFDRNTMGNIQLNRQKERLGWLPQSIKFSVGGTEEGFVFEGLHKFDAINKISDLKPNEKKVCRVLKDVIGSKGATASEWQEACEEAEGVPRSSFYKAKKNLVEGEHYFLEGDRFYPQDPQEEEVGKNKEVSRGLD